MSEPNRIIAGFSYDWTRTIAGYLPADWSLKYAVVGDAGVQKFDGVPNAAGDGWDVSVPASDTGDWVPGSYSLNSWVEQGDPGFEVRKEYRTQQIRVFQDPTGDVPFDTRSHARRMLDAIEAELEGAATAGELDLIRSAIGDSSAEVDRAKLIQLRSIYQAEVLNEERARRLENGEALPRSLAVRIVG